MAVTRAEEKRILYVGEGQSFGRFRLLYEKYDVYGAASAHQALEIIQHLSIQVVIAEQEAAGPEFLKKLAAEYPNIICILLTDGKDTDALISAIREGKIYQYVLKPYCEEALRIMTDRAIDMWHLKAENDALKTRLAKMEAELKTTERNYRLLFNEMTSGFALHEIICDENEKPRDYRFLDVNPAFEKLTGLKREDILNKTVLEILPKTEFYWIEKYGQVALTGKAITFENYSSELGRYYEVAAYSSEKNFFAVVFSDITVRKKSEELLKESEERFRAVADYSYDWESWVAPDGKLIWTNPAVERITGYSREEYMNLPDRFAQVIFEEDLSNAMFHLERGLKHQLYANDLTFRIRRKDGLLRWVSLSYQPIYGDDGRNIGLRSSIRDVSDRKRAEDELSKTKNYLDNILNSSPSAIIGINPQGKITVFNSAAEKLTGTDSNALGKDFKELSDYAEYLEDMKAVIQNKTPLTKENVQKQRGGQILYYNISVYPLISNGTDGAVVRIDDVTERSRFEAMMIQTEKMMSIAGLAAGMAHEINNPLGVILLGVQNALRRLSPEIDANIQTALSCGTDLGAIRNYLEKRGIFKYLEGIEEDGLRCAKIVSDMLNFSRRSDSQTMIRSDISQLIDDTINLAFSDYDLKKKYDFTRIRIKREYSAALKRVPCIPSEIQQVIFNLLKNAAQAMNGMNRQPVIEVKTSGSGQEAVIEVSDNGPGMDEKTRRRVFEPFFTTKNIGYGTGLGLSVSYFIIASNHRGKISVESESEKGTKFIIRLPLNSPNCS